MVLVRNNLRHWLFNLLKGTFLTRLITISSVQTVARNPSLKQLLETIDYVSLKYTI